MAAKPTTRRRGTVHQEKTTDISDTPTHQSSKEPAQPSKWAKSEAWFFNHGANIAFLTLMLAINIGMASWGTWEFVSPRFVTDSAVLRITLPIARAAGRLVTWNSAVVLITGCKFFWTQLRLTPLAYGFPIDHIMPYYHRIAALTIIVMGCVIHTIPQVVNYATEALVIAGGKPIWGSGLHTLQLLVTGIILFFTFSAFFITTLEKVRRTAQGFRFFWWTHVIGIVIVFPTLIIHGTIRGDPILLYFVAFPMALYIADSILRRYLVAKMDAKVMALSAHEDGGEKVIKLVVRNPNFEYSSGQYAELKIPNISAHEWHPFTIASAPNEEGDVEFFIKAVGRWTSALYWVASQNTSGTPNIAKVQIRGAFGAPAQNYFAYRHIVVIGSGIGVTPLLSVWKHLAKSDAGPDDEPSLQATAPANKEMVRIPSEIAEQQLLADGDVNHLDVAAFGRRQLKSFRAKLAYIVSVLESMTVNICLFVFSVMMETGVFSVWIFQFGREAAHYQAVISTIALIIFVPKLLLSLALYGTRYLKSFVFCLEFFIIALDAVSLIASIGFIQSPNKDELTAYFASFAAFVILHGIRIFHIFYTTARPPPSSTVFDQKTKDDQSFASVTGIWVSREYAGMSFAASDLIESVRGLSSKFSLQLFATRDKKVENPFVTESPQHALHAGRPDWESIMTNLLEKAYASNPEGADAVGVFFCGSPAIALTLQRVAQTVNAQHQYTYKNSRCRIMVHKENF